MRSAWILLAAAGLLAGCGGAQPRKGAPHLEMSVNPASPARLLSGTIVKVTAQSVPKTEMAWVSGTVKIFGAKPIAMKQDGDGSWYFKTMVPPMFTVPAGAYEVRTWGRTPDGEPLEGSMTYEVK